MAEFINGTLEANVSVFIIPNGVGRVSEFLGINDKWKAFTKKVIEMNGLDADPDTELLVQLWFHSQEELQSDNLARHGFVAQENGEEKYVSYSMMEYLPVSIFKGKKEGDVVDIKLPYNPDDEYKPWEGNQTILFHTTLNQKEFRYRSHGPFDGLLDKLIATAR